METLTKDQLREEILLEIERLTEIDYSKNPKPLQRQGAIALNDLLARYAEFQEVKDASLIALILVRMRDLQVRDYALGLISTESIDQYIQIWQEVIDLAPRAYLAPIASLLSIAAYEKCEIELARESLDLALATDIEYPLALLLERVYEAGWPPESFAKMRIELHPKIEATLFTD
jgi:hypothetical protein